MGALFLCPHSSVIPRAPPIYHESIFREYRDALHPSAQGTVRTTFAEILGVLARGEATAGLVNERGHARSGPQEIV